MIRILAAGVLIRCTTKAIVPFFNGTKRPGLASVAVIAGMLTNLGAMLVFLPILGLRGAALSVTCGYVVSGAIIAGIFLYLTRLSPRTLYVATREDISLLLQPLRRLLGRKPSTPAEEADAKRE